jgi:hypothetical protein
MACSGRGELSVASEVAPTRRESMSRAEGKSAELTRAVGGAGEGNWRALYTAGGVAAVTVLVLVAVQLPVFLSRPFPSTVSEWFGLFRASPLVGLINMDVLMLVDNALLAVVFVALYVALRSASPSWMTVAVVLALVSITTYLSSNTAFQMLSLSERYAAATTEAERSAALAAGEAMVATWQGSAFNVSYVLSALSILITAAVMVRSRVFSRWTGYVGVAFGTLSLVPASAGRVGLAFSLLSLLPMAAWLLLVGGGLRRLGRGAGPEQGASVSPVGLAEPLPQRR